MACLGWGIQGCPQRHIFHREMFSELPGEHKLSRSMPSTITIVVVVIVINFLTWSKPFTAEHDPEGRAAQPGNQLRPLQQTLQLPASTGMDPVHQNSPCAPAAKVPIDHRERQARSSPGQSMNSHSCQGAAAQLWERLTRGSSVLLRKEAPIVQSRYSGIEKSLTSTGTYKKTEH